MCSIFRLLKLVNLGTLKISLIKVILSNPGYDLMTNVFNFLFSKKLLNLDLCFYLNFFSLIFLHNLNFQYYLIFHFRIFQTIFLMFLFQTNYQSKS